jgi:hypothetical protein
MPKLHQRLHRNLWRAKRKLHAIGIQHPGRNGQIAVVDKLAYGTFARGPFLAFINAQGLTEERMPTIVDCDSL